MTIDTFLSLDKMTVAGHEPGYLTVVMENAMCSPADRRKAATNSTVIRDS